MDNSNKQIGIDYAAEKLKADVAGVINDCKLPPTIIEFVLRDTLEQVQDARMRSVIQQKSAYEADAKEGGDEDGNGDS